MKEYKYKINIYSNKDDTSIEEILFSRLHNSTFSTTWKTNRLLENVIDLQKESHFTYEKDRIESFKRTKDWAIKNRPELLI
jgi:hypothetical protein